MYCNHQIYNIFTCISYIQNILWAGLGSIIIVTRTSCSEMNIKAALCYSQLAFLNFTYRVCKFCHGLSFCNKFYATDTGQFKYSISE